VTTASLAQFSLLSLLFSLSLSLVFFVLFFLDKESQGGRKQKVCERKREEGQRERDTKENLERESRKRKKERDDER